MIFKQCHELKIDSDQFELLKQGLKKHEVRKEDRGFQEGDLIVLRETVFSAQERCQKNIRKIVYTGRALIFKISFINSGGDFGIMPGFVVLGLEQIKTQKLIDPVKEKIYDKMCIVERFLGMSYKEMLKIVIKNIKNVVI